MSSGFISMGYANDPHFNNAADENVTTVKNTGGFLVYFEVSNINTNDVFLQLFNEVSPVVGTSTPVQSFLIPQGNGVVRGAADQLIPNGLYFSSAITYAITTTPTGATGPATAVTVNLQYV